MATSPAIRVPSWVAAPASRNRAAAVALTGVIAVGVASAALAGSTVGWRVDGTGDFPAASPPIEWSPSENVVWATEMPGPSNASPILVAGKLFVTAERDTLLAVDAADGRILWRHANRVEDAVPAASSAPSIVEVVIERTRVQAALRDVEYELTQARRALRGTSGDATLVEQERSLVQRAASERERLASLVLAKPADVTEATGFSTPTPTSDGIAVFVAFGTGVVASYDLDGTRRWIRFVDHVLAADGAASSPVLVGDTLLVLLNDLIALDARSGDVVWRANVPARPGTPVAFAIDGEPMVVTPSGHCLRVADGAVLVSGLGDLAFASPVVRDGVLYMIQEPARAFRIPDHVAEPLAFQPLWTTRMKGERYYSSPLVAEGLIYAITRSQILSVMDASTGEVTSVMRLRLGWKGATDSVFSSPVRAGRFVMVSGFSGTTAVLEPGRSPRIVASNSLERLRSSPIFVGDAMYVRGQETLRCIARSTAARAGVSGSPP